VTTKPDGAADAGSEATTAPATARVDDQELAERSVFQASDFPTGWVAAADDGSEDEASSFEEDEFAACAGLEGLFGTDDEAEDDASGEAESPEFTLGDIRTAGSSAFVSGTDSEAKLAIRLIGGDRLKGCFSDLIVQAFEEGLAEEGAEGITLGDVTVTDPGILTTADETSTLRVLLPLTIAGEDLTFSFDFVFVREGRVFGMFYFLDFPEPFPSDLESELLMGPISRMAE
jgi:hypothetical protein